MQFYNLKILLTLKKELTYEKTYEKLSKLIASAMLRDEKLKEIHKKNEYKNYVFCNLYPTQKGKPYKIGKIYTFDIRFIDMQLAMKIKSILNIIENPYFKIIMSNLQTNRQRKITKLITLTPAIITTLKGDYKIGNDLNLVKERILSNTQKKYYQIYKTKVNIDFIKEINQTNQKPIKIPYKNMYMLGNKFEIKVKQDTMSQNLAYLAFSIGLLEKNALGMGFCNAI